MSYFPDTSEYATMIFIPKGLSSQHKVENNRPISLLDTQGKILDKILSIRLTHFQENNILINTRKHGGFRRNHGTNTALATFYGTIANIINNELKVDIVLADVSKAFDKVWQYLIKVQTSKHSNTCMLHENSVKLFRQQGCINQDWTPCWIPLLD